MKLNLNTIDHSSRAALALPPHQCSAARPKLNKISSALCAISAISLLMSGVTSAQQAATPANAAAAKPDATAVLEQIVVTGQKRAELLKDVPLAVSAYTGANLQSLNITSTTDLTFVSPSLSFSQSANVRGEGFQIRGVGTSIFSDAVEQSVGFVVDGVALARSGQASGDLLDVAIIEVLRGPQGMLFGKNASAGLVSITTKRPLFGVNTAEANASFATGNERKLQVIGNIGLGETTALRLAYGSTLANGYVRNIVRNEDLNNRDSQTFRAKLLVAPTSNLEISVIADAAVSRTRCCAWTARSAPATSTFGFLNAAAGIVPSATNLQNAAGGRFFQNGDTDGISAEITYDIAWATFTSLTAYRTWKTTDNNDPDILPINVLDRNSGSSDLVQRSQELRLTSPSGGKIEWVSGLYFSDQTNRTNNDQAGTLGQMLPLGVLLGTAINTVVTNKSTALFGQGSLKITDRVKLIAGARYTNERLALELNQNRSVGAAAGIPGRFIGGVNGSVEKNNVSWRLTGQFDMTRDDMVYATAARGFKGAGVNTLNLPSPIFEVVQPEIPTTIELGLRSTLFGGTTQFNAAAFKTEFKDFQAQVYDQNVFPGRFRVTNAGRLDTKGFEMDFVSRPIKALTISGGAAIIDSTYGDFKNIACYTGQTILPFGTARTSPRDCIRSAATAGATATTEGTGNQLTAAPRTTFNFTAKYETPVMNNTGFVQMNYFWRDKVSYSAAGDPNLVQDAYGVLGASIGIGAKDGRWQISLFGKNLADKKYVGNLISQPLLNAPGVYSQFTSPDARRIVGISVSLKLGK